MARLAFATGYGTKVHILQSTDSRLGLCGKATYQPWSEPDDPKPGDICKSCFSAGQRDGVIDWQPCPTCGGTGRAVA